ncbi:hypothetical protein OH77DRAFT_1430232 [Trametes cingulata]|nr:hypothetical protein OH77DRAFT_1430232 [Trametes cingulata]
MSGSTQEMLPHLRRLGLSIRIRRARAGRYPLVCSTSSCVTVYGKSSIAPGFTAYMRFDAIHVHPRVTYHRHCHLEAAR